MEDVSRDLLRSQLGGDPDLVKRPPPAATKVEPITVQQSVIRKLPHNDRCPFMRGGECACEANLQWLVDADVKPLERLVQEWDEHVPVPAKADNKGRVTPAHTEIIPHKVELWRVDDGKPITRTIPAPSGSLTAPPLVRKERLPERWMCTSCGWAGRGSDVSHRCDKAAVARATRKASVSEMLTGAERMSGRYRLTLWKDQDQNFHLGEEYVEGDKVVTHVEIMKDDAYDVIMGELLSAIVDRLIP